MKKMKLIIAVISIIFILMLIPIKDRLWDGGSVEYKAILYKYTKIHRLSEKSSTGYEDGWELKILGKQVAGKINTYLEALPKITTLELEEIHKSIDENLKKYRENNEYYNFASSGVDREKNRVIVELIDNSKKEQQWFRENIYDSKYIVFKQGGPYTTSTSNSINDANRINSLIIAYFQKENLNYFNLSYNYVDEKRNVVTVGLVENTKEKQTEFINFVFDVNDIEFINENKIIEFKESKDIFEARITKIDNNRLIVKVLKETKQFKKNSQVIVTINKNNEKLNKSYKVGNNLKIIFDGMVLTSNPPQISAYDIEIIT